MPLFQNSVVTKYLQAQNREKVFRNIIRETTNKEIDTIVYEPYGLTEEEIRIVEQS